MAGMNTEAGNDTQTFVSWREFVGSPYAASLALVCLAVWLHAADSLIVATMLPSIVAEIGGAALVGWSVSLYEIGSIVAGAASALLILRFGLRAPMSLAAILFGLGCILSAVSRPCRCFWQGAPCKASAAAVWWRWASSRSA